MLKSKLCVFWKAVTGLFGGGQSLARLSQSMVTLHEEGEQFRQQSEAWQRSAKALPQTANRFHGPAKRLINGTEMK
jgi:hypothetical protein